MNSTLKFYLEANKLKNMVRTGWTELGISSERLESVAEHAFGNLVLAIGLENQYKDLDMSKVFKMILVRELKKVDGTEFTTRNASEQETDLSEKLRKLTDGLVNQEELLSLFEESQKCESKEAKFVFQVSKLESDIQAKIYDLNGNFDLDKAIEDAHHYEEGLSQEIISQIKNASDGFILYDRQYYEDDTFKELSQEIQNLKSLD